MFLNSSILAGHTSATSQKRFSISSSWASFLVVGLALSVTALADPLDIWHWRNPTPTGNRLFGIGASADRYVAVGELGSIIVSEDARNWWPVESGTQNTLRAVAWGNGTWVAVGDFGLVLTSPNGMAWTSHPTGFFYNLRGVTWGGGLFVAVGENTAILTSSDGVTWVLRATGTQPLCAITWGEGTFVAVGGQPPALVPSGGFNRRVPGEPLVLTSSDGVHWALQDASVVGQVSSVAFGAGRFVAGTTSLQTLVSTNGLDWRAGLEGYPLDGMGFSAVVCAAGGFIATYGSPSTIPGDFFASADGLTWTSRPWDLGADNFHGLVQALTWGPRGGAGVAQGLWYSLRNNLIVSADGRKWEDRVRYLPDCEETVTFAGGRFFRREQAGYFDPYRQRTETTYMVSTDRPDWESQVISESAWYGLPAFGNGVWVASGAGGRVVVSTNAVEWRTTVAGESRQLLRTEFAGGTFLATGTEGTLLTSSDGMVWSRRALDTTNTLGDVAWSGGVFAVAEVGTAVVFRSSDLVSWSRQQMPTNVVNTLRLVAWEEGFVALVRTAANGSDRLMRSTDARTWTRETPPADFLARIAVGGGRLLAFRGAGSRTFHARSAGGANWTTHVLPWVTTVDAVQYYAPSDAAFGQDTFLLVHGGGFILQSDPLADSAPRITQALAAVASEPNASVTLQARVLGSAPLRYQWRRDGTNLPSATSPCLTMSAREVSAARLTVVVENSFGLVESAPALVAEAAPASLEISSDLTFMRVWGTPNGHYQLETSADLAPSATWTAIRTFQVPSSSTHARIKNLTVNDYSPVARRFYRATVLP